MPRRCMLRNRWFPLWSTRSPPSNFTPNDGRWDLQSWVHSNFRTLTLQLGPIQSRMLGLLSSCWITPATSSMFWRELSWATLREIIPHAWSQLICQKTNNPEPHVWWQLVNPLLGKTWVTSVLWNRLMICVENYESISLHWWVEIPIWSQIPDASPKRSAKLGPNTDAAMGVAFAKAC